MLACLFIVRLLKEETTCLQYLIQYVFPSGELLGEAPRGTRRVRVGSTPCGLELQDHRGDSAVRVAGSAGTVESAQEAELETELG